MITQFFTLRCLAAEWAGWLAGSTVSGVFSQQKNELLVTFSGTAGFPSPGAGTGAATLQISVEPRFTYAVLREPAARARKNSVDLFPALTGAVVQSCDAVPGERILRICFTDSRLLSLRVFGTAEGNVLLLDPAGSVIEAFKNNRELAGASIAESPRSDASGLNDLEFHRLLVSGTGKSLFQSLRAAAQYLGPLYSKEIVARAGCDPDMPSHDCTPEAAAAIRLAWNDLLRLIRSPHPVLIELPNGDQVMSVVPLVQPGCTQLMEFASCNDAVREALRRRFRRRSASAATNTVLDKIGTALRQAEQSLAKAGMHPAGDPEEEELKGNTLLAHIGELKKGMREFTADDDSVPGESIRIALDPSLPPAANAERYFRRAKKFRRDREESDRRSADLRARVGQLSDLQRAFSSCSSPEEIAAMSRERASDLADVGLAQEAKNGERIPFRTFTVAGGYEVWVGKNSANNDLLTTKHSRPNDIWMHARGAGGSHTVLRIRSAGKPVPREAIEQAAAIAAYYSKMRNAKHVPVAYCERKYVRKPKHVPEGTVYLEREEIIFVTPRLP